jgi:hypothetical protein
MNENDPPEIDPSQTITFAYLGREGIPVLCNRLEYREWYKRKGDRWEIEFDCVGDWEIRTHFIGWAIAPDSVPLFWGVSIGFPRFRPLPFRFGTREAALAFHAKVIKIIMTNDCSDAEIGLMQCMTSDQLDAYVEAMEAMEQAKSVLEEFAELEDARPLTDRESEQLFGAGDRFVRAVKVINEIIGKLKPPFLTNSHE